MKILKLIFLSSILSSFLFSQEVEVNTLLEKVHQEKNKETKTELIEELKMKLALKNKKAKEKADAIIRAKKKIPSKVYSEKSLNE